MIPSLDQIHRRNHLRVDQESLQSLPHVKLGDHRSRIIYLQDILPVAMVVTLLYLFFSPPPRLRAICILSNKELYHDTRMTFTLITVPAFLL